MNMSNIRYYIWGVVVLSLAAVLAMLITGTRPAHADGAHCWDFDGCSARHRVYAKRRHHREVTRLYRTPDDRDDRDYRDGNHCKEPVRGLGTQWIGTKGALDAAKKDWMERTRYDFGEKWIDLSNARDFESRCGRVSIGEVAGQVTYRCEIVARPCKAWLKDDPGATAKDKARTEHQEEIREESERRTERLMR